MKSNRPLPTPPGPRLAKYDNAEGQLIFVIGMILVIALLGFAAIKILMPQLFH